MLDQTEARRAWVQTVLGVTVPASAPDPAKLLQRWRVAREGWKNAMDAVDGQVNALAKVLRESGNDDLQEIADSGLMTVTGGFRTRMMAALMDIGEGDAAKLRKNGAKAAGFAEKLRDQIDGDARVIACDTISFGVPVVIRGTLRPALDELASVLHDATRLA